VEKVRAEAEDARRALESMAERLMEADRTAGEVRPSCMGVPHAACMRGPPPQLPHLPVKTPTHPPTRPHPHPHTHPHTHQALLREAAATAERDASVARGADLDAHARELRMERESLYAELAAAHHAQCKFRDGSEEMQAERHEMHAERQRLADAIAGVEMKRRELAAMAEQLDTERRELEGRQVQLAAEREKLHAMEREARQAWGMVQGPCLPYMPTKCQGSICVSIFARTCTCASTP
jgi:hypothetical protein